MSLLEYLLMGVVAASGTSAPATTRTLDADAISQPRGGVIAEPMPGMGMVQDTGGDKARKGTGKKPTKTKTKHSHKRHHKGGAQPDALTVKQKTSRNASHQ